MSTIQFDNGTKVNFNGDPTPQDVDFVASQLNIKPTPPNMFTSGAKVVGAAIKGAEGSLNDGVKQSFNPADWGKAVQDSFSSAIQDAGDKLATVFTDWNKNGVAKNVTNVGEAGLGTVNALLSPISAIFKGAEVIPGIGYVAKGINAVFGAIGSGSAEAGSQALDALPLDNATKETLRPLIKDASALIGQIVAGKAGLDEAMPFIADKTKTILDTMKGKLDVSQISPPTKLEVQSVSRETPIKVSTPATRQAEYAKSQGYEPYTPDSELPSIQVGSKPIVKDTTPIIQAEVKPSGTGSFKYEPIPQEKPQTIEETLAESKAVIPNKPIVEKPVPMTETTGVKPSKIAKDIERVAIETGLTKGFKNVAGYDPITIKEQAAKVSDFISKDIEGARSVIRGEKPLPEGMKGTALLMGIKEYIRQRPNADIAYELANSHLASETSSHAQEMRLMAERNPDDISVIYKSIRDARQKRAEMTSKKSSGTTRENAVADIKKAVSKSVSARPSWEEFITSITCK